MFDVEEPTFDAVSEAPVDLDEIPVALRAAEDAWVDLTPQDEWALVEHLDGDEMRLAEQLVVGLDADGVLAAVEESQRRVNLVQTRQLFLAVHWADLHASLDEQSRQGHGCETSIQPGGEGTPELSEFAPAEFGAVLGLSATSARLFIADALDLRHRLPRLWHRLQTGNVKIWVARRIASRTRHLSLRAAARVDDRMCEVAGRVTGGRLERILDAAIMAADPALAQAEAEAAAARQGVWVSQETDSGFATLVGKAPAPDLRAVDLSLDEIARALTVLGDTDGHDIRRAKALALLADPEATLELIRRADEALTATAQDSSLAGPHDGTDPRRRPCDLGRAVVYLHVSEQTLTDAVDGVPGGVARVHDIGPVLMEQVAGWLGHRKVTVRPVIDIAGIPPVDCYERPTAMSRAIRLRTPASCFPHSTNLSLNGDDDHTKAYLPIDKGGPPGQTAVDNLGRLERPAHRLKTHGRWKVTQPRSGIWLWRSPHGHHFLVDHNGTTNLGKL